jgi:tetratricopeptide (TPR) repeat protein
LQFGNLFGAAYSTAVNFQALTLLVALSVIPIAGAQNTFTSPSDRVATADSTAAEFKPVEAADDAAQAEVDRWLQENKAQKANGAPVSQAELEQRIAKRFEPIQKNYEEFLRRHPNYARAYLVYGSFLNDRQDERGAQVQWEKALALDPTNAAVYSNLAGRYGESGPVNKAFEFYAKAVELGPNEPVYYHNFADSLYVLRKTAATYYKINEQQVYQKVLGLYSNALRLDPQNFSFARDLAQTYYSLKPLPVDPALSSWTNALRIAHEPVDREDVFVNLARLKMLDGRFTEARQQLTVVTNQTWMQAKTVLLHNIEEREKGVAPSKAP